MGTEDFLPEHFRKDGHVANYVGDAVSPFIPKNKHVYCPLRKIWVT